jgi:hypothetical protein
VASISTSPTGLKSIQFVGSDNKRRSIRLGRVNERAAKGMKLLVERLQTAKRLHRGALDPDTADRLSALDDTIYNRIAATGLIEPRSASTLKRFLDEYVAGRKRVCCRPKRR